MLAKTMPKKGWQNLTGFMYKPQIFKKQPKTPDNKSDNIFKFSKPILESNNSKEDDQFFSSRNSNDKILNDQNIEINNENKDNIKINDNNTENNGDSENNDTENNNESENNDDTDNNYIDYADALEDDNGTRDSTNISKYQVPRRSKVH